MVKDWDGVRGAMYDLYFTQGQCLEQVKDVMTRQYSFVASERAYKHKIREWGWRTNRGTDGRIAIIRRRRRRQTIITTGIIGHGGDASVAAAGDTDFRGLNHGISSGGPINPHPSNPWNTPGSFNLGDVGKDHPPETLEACHGFEFLQQNTRPRSESDVLDQQDALGRTLLHRIVTIGVLDEVKDILSRGARIDIEDNDGNQPLHLAAIGNYFHIIRNLLKSGAKVDAKGVNGRTPVHLALDRPQTLRALLGARPNLSIPDDDGNTVLHAALRRLPRKRPRSGGVIGILLRHGANVNSKNLAGVTPFHMAVELTSVCTQECYVALLLEHDADLKLKTYSGEWPFANFVKNAWPFRSLWWREILVFLRKGADPNTQVLGQDNLLYALLENGDMIHYSAAGDIVLQLCKTANIHIPSAKGDLPLHCLLRSFFRQDYVGTTIERYLEVIETLFYRGSDPNQPNERGERPLQVLLANNFWCLSIKTALMKLLEHGADPMLVDFGDLPVYIAYRRYKHTGRDELVRTLTDTFIARPENRDGSNNSQPDPFWWQKYRAFRLQQWCPDEATQLLQEASNRTATSMPQDVAEHLPKLLISFAAEAKFEDAKNRFSNDEIGWSSIPESSHFVCILRDCKNLGIDMDVSWYHFLLEILP